VNSDLCSTARNSVDGQLSFQHRNALAYAGEAEAARSHVPRIEADARIGNLQRNVALVARDADLRLTHLAVTSDVMQRLLRNSIKTERDIRVHRRWNRVMREGDLQIALLRRVAAERLKGGNEAKCLQL